MNTKRSYLFFRLIPGLALIAFLMLSQTVSPAMATMQSFSQSASVVPTNPTLGETPQISSGALAGGQQATTGVQMGPTTDVTNNDLVPSPDTTVGSSFEGFGFDDNATENAGFVFIPPDPIGAAGTDRLLAVVNTMIEIRNKSGVLQWRDSLKDFFSPLGAATLGT
ncbi:MAG TPA: hypothetical protein VN843_06425, partial [Anaerolineales bacterium]|nr:hypothetical protein [Anaerolineales bacterium]